MEFRALSVSEISMYVSKVFEAEEMLHDIKIFGEISTFQIKSGIAYYTLKDANSIINCITFGAERYSNIKIGDQVILTGSVSYYAKGGKLNFSAYSIVPYGQGEIYKQFLLLKEELEKAGYFAKEHKKPLPENIKKIGVVTSSTGAVIQDIINVSTRRNPGINIELFPSRVQGAGADVTIIKGIEYFETTDVDVVIVARGGGSYEDLQPFNSRLLAECVYNASKVVVSAVGHETDFTIIDFVADLRAPTPSAAAELVTKDIFSELKKIEKDKVRLCKAFENLLKEKSVMVQDFSENMLDFAINNIESKKVKLNITAHKLAMLDKSVYEEKENNIRAKESLLVNLNPVKLLLKGYSQLLKNGEVITSAKKLTVGDSVDIVLSDGKAKSTITEIEV